MSLPALVLWLLVYPAALLIGLAAAVAVYLAARPRPRDVPGAVGVRRDLLVEGWRLAAVVAAVPAGILAMELSLWGLFFGERVSPAYTGLAQWLGLVLLALAPVPLVTSALEQRPLLGRPARRALVLLLSGLLLFPIGWVGRSVVWSAQRADAAVDGQALQGVLVLKGYQFITAGEMRGALARALPTTRAVLRLVKTAQADPGMALDRDVRSYLAERLERALRAAEPEVTTAPQLAAVPAIWWLTADRERTLRAYALAVPELRGRALARSGPVATDVLLDAMARGSLEVLGAVLAAAEPELGRSPLEDELIAGLAGRTEAEAPIGPLAQRIMLRDASVPSLRPIVARFARGDDPAWALVRAECPTRTPGLKTLSGDTDPAVAAGAQAVLAYVRQYCFTARRVGQ
jgi:hypothetical protein